METKYLTTRQFAAAKRVAQNVAPLMSKIKKLEDKITELNGEANVLAQEIGAHEMGIKSLTGGYTSSELVTRVVEDSGKVDKDGKPIKITKYIPNTKHLKYDEDLNMYEILDYFDNTTEEVTADKIEYDAIPMVESNQEELPYQPNIEL